MANSLLTLRKQELQVSLADAFEPVRAPSCALFLLGTLLLSGLAFGSSEKLADTPSCCLGALPTNLLSHSTPTSASVCGAVSHRAHSYSRRRAGRKGVVKEQGRMGL
jgi:hypothetical protein